MIQESGLKGKTAIVSGGSRGIGRAIVKHLCACGVAVAFTYVKNGDQAQELMEQIQASGGRAAAFQLDVRDFLKAREFVEKVKHDFGRLDILVNNAGITRDKALMMMTGQDWLEVIDTNLNGTFNLTRNVIVGFLKQKSGDVVNIASVSGVAGLARQTNYSAAKAGIIGFTKALAKEVAAYNIRVNAVAPGFIETDMLSGLRQEYRDEIIKRIPLGRIGRPEDVSGIVEFLLSQQASFITGQVIVCDGGLFIQ